MSFNNQSTVGNRLMLAMKLPAMFDDDNLTNRWSLSNTDQTNETTTAADNGGLYVHYFVLSIGVIGVVANSFMLLALAFFKKNRQRTTNVLILNQMSLDLLACVALVIDYCIIIADPDLSGPYGFFVCSVFNGTTLLGIGLTGSIVGLAMITVERYIKIVHALLHKRFFKHWMLCVAVSIPWIDGILTTVPVTAVASLVVHGRCYPLASWPAPSHQHAYGVFIYIANFITPVAVFLYCYIRIALVIKDRSKKAQNGPTISVERSNRKNSSVIRTLVAISLAFFVCWCPIDNYFFLYNIGYPLDFNSTAWYMCLSLSCVNSCLNPLLYAWQYDTVQKSVRLLLRRARGLKANEHELASLNVVTGTAIGGGDSRALEEPERSALNVSQTTEE